ncbi:hypothetical protein ACJX0J_020565, partial [Zea mays]
IIPYKFTINYNISDNRIFSCSLVLYTIIISRYIFLGHLLLIIDLTICHYKYSSSSMMMIENHCLSPYFTP